MLPKGAAASKRLNTTIKLNKSKIIQQKKILWSSYSREKSKTLTTSTCITVALEKQTMFF